MYTDIVGYTALGQRNESLSLALVKEQGKLLKPIFSRHNGREVKTMGDAFLVDFSSALDAVRCAYDIQRATREFNISLPEERRIHLRVGIHLGDVVESEGDISGDAVNVASRIESLADDGGVCLTRQVFDHIQNKIELPLVSLGTRVLKNVSMPIEVYKMVMPWNEEEAIPPMQLDKRRIAVLPFANLSSDPNDEYFAEGMTEELITTLSRISGIRVISRSSVMRYKRDPKPITDVASELEAGTVLEGSVRKAGNAVRIAINMIDSREDEHVWAESYDRNLENIFAIETDISQRVAEVLKVQLLGTEKKRLQKIPTLNMEAYTLYLKGRHYVNERTQEGFHKAIRYFEEAIKRDPNYTSPYAGLSDCYHLLENWGFLQPQVAWPKAMEYATKALELDDTLAEAHTSMAISLAYVNWDWKGSEREYERALELNPSYATAHHWYAMHNLMAQRRWEEATREIQQAAKLDPFSPIIATNTGVILFLSGRHEEGVKQFRYVLEMNPEFAYAHDRLGAALVVMSSIEEGVAEIEKAVDLSPESTIVKSSLVYAYTAAGRKKDAERVLQEFKEISKERYIPSTMIAVVYAALGEKDHAFKWLEKAAEERTSTLPENVNEPSFDGIRSDPRFHDLLQRIGLE